MAAGQDDASTLESQEALLYSARHGEVKVVRDLIQAKKDGQLSLDISCKGKSKSNLGWTPLHLATYFGHADVVEILLEAGADVDALNDLGDTALHKASFIGREELVVLLLKHGADVNIMNGEGRLARDVCKTQEIHRLLVGAEQAERRARENALLAAAREGRLDEINKLLTDSHPPSINCVDAQGNTALHCSAYRGYAHVAVILLQNGIDTTIRNKSGQLAVDMARSDQMRSVLSVRPVRRLQCTAARFEGPLLRRSRFLGWRPVWAVLQRGVLAYYGSRAEAAGDVARRARKYLDGARVAAPAHEPALLVLSFSDGDSHRLAVPRCTDPATQRQTWITALNEHISYSGHYLWAGAETSAACEATEDLEEDCKPLGSMQDAITNATNSLALLDSQLKECATIVSALERTVQVGSTLHQSAYMRFQHACATGQRALAQLRHCGALVAQARDADSAKLRFEEERNRVLEEALAGLARQHHALERSVAEELQDQRTRKKKSTSRATSNDNFFDVYEDSDSDTLVTAGLASPLGALSPWGSEPDLTPTGSPPDDLTPTNGVDGLHEGLVRADSLLSTATSLGTLVSHDGHVYRNARSHPGLHRPSSLWSI